MPTEPLRPTKKQRELLTFIENFIAEHGYSPSYREIMGQLNYSSVATVAAHVNNLITRGHLRKRGQAARSLELVQPSPAPVAASKSISAGQEKWLIEQVEQFFQLVETGEPSDTPQIDQLYVLVGALKVLGLDGAAQSFISRLSAITTNP